MISKNNNLFKKIKSQYILKQIFENLIQNKKLDVVRYNKEMQKKFEIKLIDYKEFKNILESNMRSIPEYILIQNV